MKNPLKFPLKFSTSLLLVLLLSGCIDGSEDRQTKKLIQDLIATEAWEECTNKSQIIPPTTKISEFYQQSLGLCALKLAEIQAQNNDFTGAFTSLVKIPNNTKEAAQKNIYFQKWSQQIINNAQEKAKQNNYKEAFTLVKVIPANQVKAIDAEVLQLIKAWQENIIRYAQSVYEKNGIEKAQSILLDLTDEQQKNKILTVWQNTDKQNAAKYAQIANAFDDQKWQDVVNFYQGLSTDYWRQRSDFFVNVAQQKLAQPKNFKKPEVNDLFATYKYRAAQSNNRTHIDAYINPKNVRYNEEIQYYSVKGKNKQELTHSIISANISEVPGIHAAGLTETSIGGNWLKEYRKTNQGESCTLKEVKLELNVVITLPKWVDYNAADPTLQSDWDIFSQSVEDHEHEHKNIARRVVNDLDKKLASIGSRKDCQTLDHEVKSIWNRTLSEHDELQKQYDIREGLIQI
jgi:predicted secreted Zn-dependent protease